MTKYVPNVKRVENHIVVLWSAKIISITRILVHKFCLAIKRITEIPMNDGSTSYGNLSFVAIEPKKTTPYAPT